MIALPRMIEPGTRRCRCLGAAAALLCLPTVGLCASLAVSHALMWVPTEATVVVAFLATLQACSGLPIRPRAFLRRARILADLERRVGAGEIGPHDAVLAHRRALGALVVFTSTDAITRLYLAEYRRVARGYVERMRAMEAALAAPWIEGRA